MHHCLRPSSVLVWQINLPRTLIHAMLFSLYLLPKAKHHLHHHTTPHRNSSFHRHNTTKLHRDMSELAFPRYRAGFALEPKKVQSFLQNSLIDYAKNHGIDLIQIDPNTPLHQQGPFHCIIHKLHSQQWTQHLNEFSSKHPNVPILDPPESVDRLHNRVTMLDSVTHLQITLQNDTVVGAPNQVVVNGEKNAVEELGSLQLRFPVIAKPLMADGSAISHKLCLVFDREGLDALSTCAPIVLQEFVNHGGVVFKIYVAGRHVTCVKRRSLPDISEEEVKALKGVVPFSQVSNLKGSRDGEGGGVEEAEMPPEGLVSELAKALKEALGLNLFNVDVIRDGKDGTRYLVIDINYFPGYAKLPSYEPFFTDFLLDVVHHKTA